MWLKNIETGLEWEVEGALAQELATNPLYVRIEAPDGSVFREEAESSDMTLRPSGATPTAPPLQRSTEAATAQTETESPNRDANLQTSPTDKPDFAAGKPSRRVSRSRQKNDV
ncbi:MAG: hypothetical protein MSG64_16695 [Pyrinomonadaceae bacterium MAG19_C2-C3]|nr:hypothetical protein [Pyrinomonadaceae bacterium MAG19_C2-C3]